MIRAPFRQNASNSSKAGFTLLELLIAMMLTGVIAMVLFSTYRMVLENGQHLQRIVGERETGRMVKAVIDNDLTSMLLSSDDDAMPLPKQAPIELSANYYEQTGLEAIEERDDEVILSFATTHSLVNTRDTTTPAPVCIEYVLKDSRHGKNLVRRERAYCGIEANFPWTDILMLQGLKSVEVALLIGTEFQIEWANPKETPSALRFVFEYEGIEELETFIVPLLPEESTDENS